LSDTTDVTSEVSNEGAEAGAEKRNCAACGKPGMATATRCGFCWTKIVHAANG